MSIHWFETGLLNSAVDGDYLIEVSDDDHDGTPDVGVMEENRQLAEDYVKSRVSVLYDVSQWDVDTDNDGISDNIDGVLLDCAIAITIYKLASRRIGSPVPDTIQRNYDIAEMKLERIANGTILLGVSPVGTTLMQGNMKKSDLGNATENGEPLPWSEIL